MMVRIIEPDCKHEWNVNNGAVVEPVRIQPGGKVRLEFMDSQAYQKGVDDRGNQYRMLRAIIDITPEQARKLAGSLMTFADEQERVIPEDEKE